MSFMHFIYIVLACIEFDIHFDFLFQIYQREDIGSNSATMCMLTNYTLMMPEDTTIRFAGMARNVYGGLFAGIAGITVAGTPLTCDQLN